MKQPAKKGVVDTKQPLCVHKNPVVVWGGAATVILVLAATISLLVDVNGSDLNGSCAEGLTLERVSECTSEKYREDFLRLYRDKIDEKLMNEVTCGHGVAEVYTEFLEEVDSERFPEIYDDFSRLMAEYDSERAYTEPIYYAASAVVVDDGRNDKNVLTVGPTRAYLERNPNKVWVEVGRAVKIDFYHNFYTSTPILGVPWAIEREFQTEADGYALTSELTVSGAEAEWGENDYLNGKVNLLEPEGIFYLKMGSSVHDYLEYPVVDSYELKFKQSGNYQFCEKVSSVGRTSELTRACVEIRARKK